jgi:hypothetical protein
MGMRTRLFDWARENGISMNGLARQTGYSWRQLYRARADQEHYVTPAFRDRIVGRLGPWARSLFFDCDSSLNEQEGASLIHPHTQEAAARRGLAAEDSVKQEAA